MRLAHCSWEDGRRPTLRSCGPCAGGQLRPLVLSDGVTHDVGSVVGSEESLSRIWRLQHAEAEHSMGVGEVCDMDEQTKSYQEDGRHRRIPTPGRLPFWARRPRNTVHVTAPRRVLDESV